MQGELPENTNPVALTEKEVVQRFQDCLFLNDAEGLKNLLDKEGLYEVQDEDLDGVVEGRKGFIHWILARLNDFRTEKGPESRPAVKMDKCAKCKVGKPVLIFEEGKWPRKIKHNAEREKTGLMLDIADGRVKEIRFCYVFAKTENKPVFVQKAELLKKYMFKFDGEIDRAREEMEKEWEDRCGHAPGT